MAEGQDLKESFEIGREGVDQEGCENLWPDRFDGEGKEEEGEGKVFKREMLEFFEVVKQLHVQIMRAIAVGLGIDEYWFDGYTDAGDNTLRLLHYPEVDAEVFRKNRNTVRAGAHTDYGSITCLFQVSFSFFFPLIWQKPRVGLRRLTRAVHLWKILSDLGAPSMCLTMALLQLEANDSASCIPLSEEAGSRCD